MRIRIGIAVYKYVNITYILGVYIQEGVCSETLQMCI